MFACGSKPHQDVCRRMELHAVRSRSDSGRHRVRGSKLVLYAQCVER